METSTIVRGIAKHANRFLLCPIEVFVFHAVSDNFDERVNERIDWTSTEEFKRNILILKEQYEFIPLLEVCSKLKNDLFRKKRYAALTCDDGFRSVLGILPFLEEQKIPLTIFVNPKYLDGKSKRDGYAEEPQYITMDELLGLTSPLVTIGMHGYEHNDATQMAREEFASSVGRCIEILKLHPHFVYCYAYTWGRYSDMTQQVLREKRIVPVLTDGGTNYRYRQGISRKPIDGCYLRRR